jgi:ATP-dependent DNA ligase
MEIDNIAKPKQLDIEKAEKYTENQEWVIEVKYDGSRQFLIGTETGTEMYNKRGKDKTRHFPDVTDEIALPESTILDGEIIVTDELHKTGNKNVLQKRDGGTPVVRESGKMNFKEKMKMKQYPAQFVAFDIIKYKGESVKDMPLQERRKLLEDVVNGLGEEVTVSKRYESLEKGWKEVLDKKMEGVILKKPETEYPVGRTPTWRKVKNIKDTIITARDYEEHNKGITVIGEDDHDDNHRLTVNGRVSKQVRQEIEDNSEAEVEVSYLERSKNGKLREPRFSKLIEKHENHS